MKGSRLDSFCKGCKKSARKSKYVSEKSENAFAGVRRLIEVFSALQSDLLDQYYARLMRITKNAESTLGPKLVQKEELCS